MKRFYILIIFISFLFSGCESDDITNLKDVLYVKYKNAEMPAYIYGNFTEKIFVIVLHGGPGGKGLEYRIGSLAEIESRYAVVYLDQRNSGMSSGNYPKEDITVELMAEDVLALVKVLKFKYGQDIKLFLLGHSWGGTLGSEVLLQDQSQFLGWIEVDGGHNLKNLFNEQLIYYPIVANEQIALGNSVDFWQEVLETVNALTPDDATDDNITALNVLGFDCESQLKSDGVLDDPSSLPGNLGSALYQNNPIISSINGGVVNSALNDVWMTSDYTPRLQEITIPSLVMWGKYDMVIPYAQGLEAYNSLGSASKSWVLYEKSGHSPLVDEYSSFTEELATFIEANK